MKGGKDIMKTRSHINCLSVAELFNLFPMGVVAGIAINDRTPKQKCPESTVLVQDVG